MGGKKRGGRSKKIKLLIFDFDGVLVDTKQLYKNSILFFLRKHGYDVKERSLEKLLGMRLEIILRKFDIKRAELWKIYNEVNKGVLRHAAHLKPCSFIKNVNNIKIKKILITNSLKNFVMPTIQRFKIKFDKIYGSEDFESKQQEFKQLFKNFRIKSHEAVYIGDRAQDVQIAKQVRCKSIIISNKYSWNSLAEIKKQKPDAIIKSLRNLDKAIRRSGN